MCTSTMDELPKKAYEKPDDLYKYKRIPIPPLEMIDDVLTVTTAEKTSSMNKMVNTFVEHKRLKLSQTKWHRIHMVKAIKNAFLL